MDIEEITGFLAWLYDRHLKTLDEMLAPYREAMAATENADPSYRAPEWLEAIARQEMDGIEILRGYRHYISGAPPWSGQPLNAMEARHLLTELVMRQQRSWERLLKPYMAELVLTNFYRPPDAVLMPDGQVMRYVGPTMTEIAGRPYTPPDWLGNLLTSDLLAIYRVLAKEKRADAKNQK